MRPARYFSIIQLSNSRDDPRRERSFGRTGGQKRRNLTFYCRKRGILCIILSLTVIGRKNRCIPCIYWGAAIFSVVSNYSNLFLPFAFFLDCSHFTFGYELVVCPEPTGLMKIICDLFPLIQRDKSLLLYPGEIHSFQCIQQFLTGIF